MNDKDFMPITPQEFDVLNRNAQRYQYLREHWEELSGLQFAGSRPPGKGGYLHHKSDPAAVDEAIDKARGAVHREDHSEEKP